jgi:hypothetical protein
MNAPTLIQDLPLLMGSEIHTPQMALLFACGIARYDFPQQTAENAQDGSFRTKKLHYDVFPGVLIVTFRRAAAATPSSIVDNGPWGTSER